MRTRTWGWLLGALLLGGCGWEVVGSGHSAVFARYGEVDQKCYPEGLYFYNPFTYDVTEIDTRVQAYTLSKATAATRDLQDVHADMVINFEIDKQGCHVLFREVGKNFVQTLVGPGGLEELKAATAHFTSEKIIQERPKLKQEIENGLRARLSPYKINVRAISLTDFGFSQEFTKAIERKQVEEQNVQRAEFLRQQAVKEAERQVALAEGQAKANALVRQSLSGDLLQFEALKKWNGVLPQVTGSGGVPLLTLPAATPTEAKR